MIASSVTWRTMRPPQAGFGGPAGFVIPNIGAAMARLR
jgi:hypothetical protein